MSFSDHLKRYAAARPLRLHTPGHKGTLDPHDITELTDGSFPAAQIAAAEANIAAHYRARHAFLLAGGSSQGVKAAVYFSGVDGIVDVNSHRSVFDGYKLSGKRCAAVGTRGSVRPITVSDISARLDPHIGAVIVTSPTYFGFCADIDGIAEFCRVHGLMLIIDGAHGAHFGSSDLLPPRFSDKCDICNMSTHKTMSALTQGAVLTDNLDGAASSALGEAVALMGTTSPSYLLYESIENAVSFAQTQECRAAYASLYGAITELEAGLPFLKNDDFTRLVLDCAELGIDARTLNDALVRRNVYSELVTDRYIVFLFTAADGVESVERLASALRSAITELK